MDQMEQMLSAALPPSASNRGFFFPSAYGGAVQSPNPPMIHELLGKLRREIGAVEAKKSEDKFGPKFPVRGAKDLNQKLANALNSLNMQAPVVEQEVNFIDTDKIPANERQSGQPVFRTLVHVKSRVRLIAPDTSFIDCVGSGHGGDVDDKAGGKASTYAWKDAILKGLSIPHEDMVDTDDNSSTSEEESGGGRKARGKAAEGGGEGSMGAGKGSGKGRGSRSTGKVEANTEVDSSVRGTGGSGSTGETDAKEPANVAGKDLKAVLDAIKAADSISSLEQIRTDIKSDVYLLAGADRLKATEAWVMRKKELGK